MMIEAVSCFVLHYLPGVHPKYICLNTVWLREFFGSPVVRARCPESVPGQGTKIPQVVRPINK